MEKHLSHAAIFQNLKKNYKIENYFDCEIYIKLQCNPYYYQK